MQEVTEEIWDLAELKWKAYTAGCLDVWKLHPVLELETSGCSFCSIFYYDDCIGCPLLVGSYDIDNYTHCCGGLYMIWEDLAMKDEKISHRKEAGAVLRFIRDRRWEWEKSQ